MLAAAVAGSSALLLLDPLTLLTRTFGLYLQPALNAVATGALFLFYDRGLLPDLMVWIDTTFALLSESGNVSPSGQ